MSTLPYTFVVCPDATSPFIYTQIPITYLKYSPFRVQHISQPMRFS